MRKNKYTNESFINLCMEKFPGQYNYSECNLLTLNKSIDIICNIHNLKFKQIAKDHLKGYAGCPICKGDKIKNSTMRITKTMTNEQFINKSNLIHNNKFDYSKTEYIGNRYKITIICPNHGEFIQVAEKHLKGFGCKKCTQDNIAQVHKKRVSKRKKKDLDRFINKSKSLYGDKFDYSQIKEFNCNNVRLKCTLHPNIIIDVTPKLHLFGEECPMCQKNMTNPENIISLILSKYNLEFEIQKNFPDLLGLTNRNKLRYDFYIPDKKVLIEYDGIHHFKQINYSTHDEKILSNNFIKNHYKDRLKDTYAIQNNLYLLRIPYYVKINYFDNLIFGFIHDTYYEGCAKSINIDGSYRNISKLDSKYLILENKLEFNQYTYASEFL